MSQRWRRARAVAQGVWLLLVAAFTVRFAVVHGREWAALGIAASWTVWLGGFAYLVAAKGAISLMVHAAWKAAGADMGLGPAVLTYNLSQLPKYLPGGVWPYVSRVHMARVRSMSMPRIWGGLALETTLLLGGALILALAWVDVAALLHEGASPGWTRWIGVGRGVAALGLMVAWGAAWRRSSQRAAWVRATLLSLVAWGCIGLSFHHVATGLMGEVPLRPVAGLFALAWAVGFVAVFSPAGLGVREVILGVGLATLAPTALVGAVVLGHRLLYVAADVTCALAARLFLPSEPDR